ncbi:hypothetical protein IG631_24130 [Alternaria alternata]|nr:hypothetical protein IG631_24130 [Alternaria alternata]
MATVASPVQWTAWLNNLCGSEQGWHGLPKHWRQLAAPTPADMIPWRWSIKPFRDAKHTSIDNSESSKPTQTCAPTEWKIGSLVMINVATLLTGCLGLRTAAKPIARMFPHYLRPQSWFLTGLWIVGLHLCANLLNAALVQSTFGYGDVSIIQIVLLWCSMPRLTWLTVLLIMFQPFRATSFFMAASCLFAETILQVLSAYHMVTTVAYGREHSFYNVLPCATRNPVGRE